MLGFTLRKNLVFNWDGVVVRIDRLTPNDEILLESASDGRFLMTSRDQLLADYRKGKIRMEDCLTQTNQINPPIYGRPLQDLPVKVRDAANKRYQYIDRLLALGSPIFTKEYVIPIIKQIAIDIDDKEPPSPITLYRWYTRYIVSNDWRSLIPRTDQRGAKNLRQDERILALLEDAITQAFKLSPKAGSNDVYIRLKGLLDSENQRRLSSDQLRIPSRRTVFRLMKRLEAYDICVLKNGKKLADARYKLTKKGTVTFNILERVEVDHTPLDLFLICEETWLPLGRPTLTMVIDHFSRMPLGYYLTFDSPSAAAVMGALRHAILPKTPTPEVVEGLKIEHRWPCFGLMNFLVLDNGLEFHANTLESVALDLGIRLQYCPKHAPQFKGTIERFLKTINYFFVHQLPGTSMARLHQRGDYDPAKHALLTMAEFRHVFEKWLLDVYAQTLHRGIGITPWAKWEEGLKRSEPILPSSLTALQKRIGLITERHLGREGIKLKNITYSGPTLEPILRKYGEGVKLRVLYDPEDLGEIQIWPPNTQESIEVPARDYSYAKGLTSFQHEMICTQLREEGKNAVNADARDCAKYSLATSIENLMVSRKQRHRRQAAALRGITSNKPGRPALNKTEKSSRPRGAFVGNKALTNIGTMPELLMPFKISANKDGQ